MAVAALRLHNKLGIKRRTATVNIDTLAKLNEEWPADLPAPSRALEGLFVYAMQIAQPAAQKTGQQTAPVAGTQSPRDFGPAADDRPSTIAVGAQSLEQLCPITSPITAPTTGTNHVSMWIPFGHTASISVWANSPTIQQAILRVHSSTHPLTIFAGTTGGTGPLRTTDSKTYINVAGDVFISLEFNWREDVNQGSWKPSPLVWSSGDKHHARDTDTNGPSSSIASVIMYT